MKNTRDFLILLIVMALAWHYWPQSWSQATAPVTPSEATRAFVVVAAPEHGQNRWKTGPNAQTDLFAYPEEPANGANGGITGVTGAHVVGGRYHRP